MKLPPSTAAKRNEFHMVFWRNLVKQRAAELNRRDTSILRLRIHTSCAKNTRDSLYDGLRVLETKRMLRVNVPKLPIL